MIACLHLHLHLHDWKIQTEHYDHGHLASKIHRQLLFVPNIVLLHLQSFTITLGRGWKSIYILKCSNHILFKQNVNRTEYLYSDYRASASWEFFHHTWKINAYLILDSRVFSNTWTINQNCEKNKRTTEDYLKDCAHCQVRCWLEYCSGSNANYAS